MTAAAFRNLIDTKGKLAAAQEVDGSVKNEKQADLMIWKYVTRLLDCQQYTAAAVVLWGTKIFNPHPKAVRDIWRVIKQNCKILLQGCGSVGKSYSPVAWLLLDWLRDPHFTNTKIISTTKGHAKGNTFSTLVRLYRQACIRLPGIVTSDYIGLDTKEKKSGIAVIAIPVGDDGKGRLQGFHPDPRPQDHPKLGPSSRVRAFMDECEEIPLGVWEGIDNMLVAMDGMDTIKVIGAYNPKDQTTKTAQNAEPEDGWDSFDIEKGVQGSDEWTSKNGWHVLRIDGKKTENVATRKTVYPGFMTYSGFRELELKDGGNSINYYCFGRGAYPPEGAVGVIVSSAVLQGCRGEFIFTGRPIKVGGVDIAVDGRDACVFTVGRCGLASAFQPAKGKLVKFNEPRLVLQADQQFTIKKGSTKIVGDGIMQTAIKLGIAPEYLSVDRTGNGGSIHDYLRAIWSEDVQGIDFSKPATDIKILEQDQYSPEELYEGIVTEVWFALAKWAEFGFFALSPGIRKDPLESEILGRRCVIGAGKMLRVEKKDDYKKRLGHSPDYGDSLTIFVHAARKREGVMGSMTDTDKKEEQPRQPQHGAADVVAWLEDASV